MKELNIAFGIADVMPWRAHGSIRERSKFGGEGVVDECGIPQCQHCGGTGVTVGFVHRRGGAYVTFRCANPPKGSLQCQTELQSVACAKQPYVLGVLSRENPLYFALRNQGKPKERSQSLGRRRQAVGGNNFDTRPKVIGFGLLELRAAVAEFTDIFRICLRHGWIGTHSTRNTATPRKRDGREGVRVLRATRRKLGLLLPRGPKAKTLYTTWNGVVPQGWLTAAERKAARRGSDPPSVLAA